MVKTNDDKDKKDTLSFSLSGIKFTKDLIKSQRFCFLSLKVSGSASFP